MAASQSIENHLAGAEIHRGAELCKLKSAELLDQFHLPRGLLPIELEEVGFNQATGFVWLKQKKRTDHTFKKVGRLVSYAPEITAFIKDRRLKMVTGVKTREFLIWISISEMYISGSDSSRITFKTSSGLSQSLPVSTFDPELETAEQK